MGALVTDTAKAKKCGAPAYLTELKNVAETEACEARNGSPKSSLGEAKMAPKIDSGGIFFRIRRRLGQISSSKGCPPPCF